MKFNEAFKQGLLSVGTRVETGASGHITTDVFTGIVVNVRPNYVDIRRDDARRGTGSEASWEVHVDNQSEINILTTVGVGDTLCDMDVPTDKDYHKLVLKVRTATQYLLASYDSYDESFDGDADNAEWYTEEEIKEHDLIKFEKREEMTFAQIEKALGKKITLKY